MVSDTVGIVGLSYLGLPLAIRFCKQGVDVYRIDKASEKIDPLINVLHIISRFLKWDRVERNTCYSIQGLDPN